MQYKELPTFDSKVEQRIYRHIKCDSLTTISGNEFSELCFPWSRTRTLCVRCNAPFELEEFEWEDTEENLVAYLDRIKDEDFAAPHNRMRKWGCLLGIVFASIVGFFSSAIIHALGFKNQDIFVHQVVLVLGSFFVFMLAPVALTKAILDPMPDFRQFR